MNPVTQGSLVTGTNTYGPEFVETDQDGTQWIFAGSGASDGYQPGELEKMIPPGGSGTVAYSYTRQPVDQHHADQRQHHAGRHLCHQFRGPGPHGVGRQRRFRRRLHAGRQRLADLL